MKKKRIILSICAAAAVVAVLAAVFFDALSDEKIAEKTGIAMGSVVTVKLYGTEDEEIADRIICEITDEDENLLSRYHENSQIYKLNNKEIMTVSPEAARILEKSLKIAADSDGAFDITIGALSSLWDFDADAEKVPANDEIQSTLAFCGYEKIIHDGDSYTLPEGLVIDLGAVGKGAACDKAFDILKENDAKGAVVSVGGSVLTYGENSRKKEWTVGIRTPETDDASYFAKLTLSGTHFISTSGSYEKCFTRDGMLYHHILSPESGYPADSGLKSVTIISDSGLVSDALSTACFVLGPDGSAEILKKYNAEAVFVDNENNVYITDGILNNFESVNDSYHCYTYGK